MFNDSETLLGRRRAPERRLRGRLGARASTTSRWGGVGAGFLVLLLIGKAYVDDSRRRAEESSG